MTIAAKKEIGRAVTDSETILATADVLAPPDRVLSALVTKELERWWGSADTYRMTDWRADFREGGLWSVVVRNADGVERPASGEFLEIEQPCRVVQTRKYDWDFPQLGRRVTTVTYRLDRIAAGTRVTVRHDGFTGFAEAAKAHADGWLRVLNWLDDHLRADPATSA
jgi:uncharacterized protein YndB with AHSA1/START domain